MVTKTDPVEVKFSADTSSLKEGTSVASNSVKEAIDRINTSVVGMGQSITTNTAIGGQALQGMAATVTTAMGSIGTVINAVLLPITLLIAAWNTLSGAIEAASDEAAQVRSLMNAFGMASDEAGKLNVALQLLGLSSEEYIGIAMKFNRQLRNNEDGMNALGVKTRDNNGNLLSQQELLRNALTTMLDYKAGVDRNAYAQANFGRSAEDAYKFLRLNDEALARGAEMAKKYGLVMSGDALEGMKQYKLEMNAIKVLTDEFKERLGEALIPVLTKLAQLFIQLASAVLPAFSKAMEYAAIGLDVYASLMEIWVTLVKTGFEVVTLSVMTFANTAASALRFDGQATATWERGMEQIKNAVLRRAAEIATLSGDLKKKLFDRTALSDDPVMPLGSGKNLTYSGQDKQDKSSRMPAFEEQLTQAKLLYQEQNNLREMSKQQEKAFWQEIAATHKLSKEEQLAIDKTIASLQIEINKKIFKDKQDLLKAEIESSERAALAKVKIAE